MTDNEPEQTDPEDHDASRDENDGEQLHSTVGPHAGRRDFLKGIGAAAGAAAVGSTAVGSSSADDEIVEGSDEDYEVASVDLAAFGDRVDAGHDAIFGVLTGDWVEFSTPYDEDEAADALADNLHDDIYASGVEVANWTDLHLAAVQNNLVMVSDFIRNNVQYRVVEEAADGATEEEVIDAAVDEAEETIAQIEENYIQAYMQVAVTIGGLVRNAEANDDLGDTEPFLAQGYSEDGDHIQTTSGIEMDRFADALDDDEEDGLWREYPLANGEEVTFFEIHTDAGSYPRLFSPFAEWPTSDYPSDDFYPDMLEEIRTWSGGEFGGDIRTAALVEERDGTDGSLNNITMFDSEEWMEVHEEILTLREEEPQYAEDIAETLYEPASEGEITPEEVSGAAAIMDVADTDEWEDANEAAAVYRSTGMSEGEEAAKVETAGTTYEGVLFWTLPDDEEDDYPFAVGEEIDPDEIDGSMYLAAEVVDEAEPDELAYPVEFALREEEGSDETFEDATVRVYDDAGEVIAEDEDPSDGETTLNVEGGSNREFEVQWNDEDDDLVEVSEVQNLNEGSEVVVYRDTESMEIFESEEWIGYDEPEEGDIVANELIAPFELAGTESGDPLDFPDRELVEPDASQEEMIDRLIEAYEAEQESQEELEVVITEDDDGGDGGGVIVDDDNSWLMWAAGLAGVGLLISLAAAAADGGSDEVVLAGAGGDNG